MDSVEIETIYPGNAQSDKTACFDEIITLNTESREKRDLIWHYK